MDRVLVWGAHSPGFDSSNIEMFLLLSALRWKERNGASYDKIACLQVEKNLV